MQQQPTSDEAKQRLRELAERLNCLTDDDHRLLSGWSEETIKAKRRRGEGPPYVRHGLHFFYPVAGYTEYLHSKVRTRIAVATSAML